MGISASIVELGEVVVNICINGTYFIMAFNPAFQEAELINATTKAADADDICA